MDRSSLIAVEMTRQFVIFLIDLKWSVGVDYYVRMTHSKYHLYLVEKK